MERASSVKDCRILQCKWYLHSRCTAVLVIGPREPDVDPTIEWLFHRCSQPVDNHCESAIPFSGRTTHKRQEHCALPQSSEPRKIIPRGNREAGGGPKTTAYYELKSGVKEVPKYRF